MPGGKKAKPPVSQAQRKAMYSAAAGHSTLGIPQSVGKEKTAVDKPGKLPARVSEGKPVRQSVAKDKVSPRPAAPKAGRPARGRGL